jgi:hypothetical protein
VRVGRLHQCVLITSTLALSWLGMMVIHVCLALLVVLVAVEIFVAILV